MKKYLSFLGIIFIIIPLINSCNQNDNPTPVEPIKYRLVSSKVFNDKGVPLSESNYTFEGDKISHLEKLDGEDQYIADYSYEKNKVLANATIYDGPSNVRNVSIEYVFQNGNLSEATSWEKSGNDSVISMSIQFEYENDNLVQFIESRASKPYMKAIYQYENDKLSNFILYYFNDNEWEKWYSEEYSYNNGFLHELIVSMAIIDPSNFMTIFKVVYQYHDNLLEHTDNYTLQDSSWVIDNYDDYTYDVHNNLVKQENRNASNDSLSYYIEYQYEEGYSNLRETLYLGSFYDLKLIYPTPEIYRNFNLCWERSGIFIKN